MTWNDIYNLSLVLAGFSVLTYVVSRIRQRSDQRVHRRNTVVTHRADGTPNVWYGVTHDLIEQTERSCELESELESERFPDTIKIYEN